MKRTNRTKGDTQTNFEIKKLYAEVMQVRPLFNSV